MNLIGLGKCVVQSQNITPFTVSARKGFFVFDFFLGILCIHFFLTTHFFTNSIYNSSLIFVSLQFKYLYYLIWLNVSLSAIVSYV